MRTSILLSLVCALFLLPGCNTVQSMNGHRSALRAGGDITMTVVLEDATSVEDVEQRKVELLEILNGLEVLIDSGQLDGLANAQIIEELIQDIPEKYRSIARHIQGLADTQLPVDKVPEDILRMAKAFIQGAKTGVAEYRIEDRAPENTNDE